MHPILQKYSQTNAFGADHNLQLTIIDPGKVKYTMQVQPKHLALQQVVHGGVIAGLMDAAISVAGLSLVCEEGKAVGTIEFKINYLAPATPNMELVALGTVLNAGKRLLTVSGEISDRHTGKKIAIATGTLNAYPAERAGLTD